MVIVVKQLCYTSYWKSNMGANKSLTVPSITAVQPRVLVFSLSDKKFMAIYN